MSALLKKSQKQETRIAKAVGGRRTPGSGNGFRKNDVRTDDLSLEMKYTGKKQYTLKAVDLEQGEKHAIMDGREFAFGIELNGRNWIVLSEDDWLALRQHDCAAGVERVREMFSDPKWLALSMLHLHQIRDRVLAALDGGPNGA